MSYRLAVTRAFAEPDGSTIFGDIGLHALTEAGIDWHVLDAPAHRIDAGEIADDDAVLVLGHERFDADSIPAGGRLRHVARFGAGFDAVDVDACTTAGIVVTNTAEAVRRPVAQASVAMLFALAHNLLQKDRLVRTGGWDDRAQWRGHGLDGRTIGVMGLGGIGRELAGALTALGLTVIAWNRSDRAAEARRLEIELVAFDDLFRRSDYVVLTVSGNAGTQHLVGARELGLMAPHASIVNVARGSVLDEAALVDAVREHRIAGAALDVFEQEPLPSTSPLLALDGLVLAPHSLCWTDAFTASVSDSVRQAVLEVRATGASRFAVNAPRDGRDLDAASATR